VIFHNLLKKKTVDIYDEAKSQVYILMRFIDAKIVPFHRKCLGCCL